MDKIKVEPVGFPTREPMLAEGNVDAVTGFSCASYLNRVRLGVVFEIDLCLSFGSSLRLRDARWCFFGFLHWL